MHLTLDTPHARRRAVTAENLNVEIDATYNPPMDSVDRLIAQWAHERPDLDTAPLAVVARVIRIAAWLSKSAEKWLSPLGLTWESFSLIVTLRRAGAPFQRRPSELLEESLLSSGAMTNRIDRVEALGLVVRLRDPNDRRGVIVQLTPEGRKLADKAIEVHSAELKALLKGIRASDRATLKKVLAGWLSDLEGGSEA
jgi:DNA-binding MarR family transcriptional regulator